MGSNSLDTSSSLLAALVGSGALWPGSPFVPWGTVRVQEEVEMSRDDQGWPRQSRIFLLLAVSGNPPNDVSYRKADIKLEVDVEIRSGFLIMRYACPQAVRQHCTIESDLIQLPRRIRFDQDLPCTTRPSINSSIRWEQLGMSAFLNK